MADKELRKLDEVFDEILQVIPEDESTLRAIVEDAKSTYQFSPEWMWRTRWLEAGQMFSTFFNDPKRIRLLETEWAKKVKEIFTRPPEDVKPGDEIIIEINGKSIITTIDKNGTQRLPEDDLLRELIDSELLSLNKLATYVCAGRFPEDLKRKIYQNIGYSVCGYSEVFTNDEISNPLWD